MKKSLKSTPGLQISVGQRQLDITLTSAYLRRRRRGDLERLRLVENKQKHFLVGALYAKVGGGREGGKKGGKTF